MPNPILDAAKKRLIAIASERSALDQEERELRAMVAAAERASAAPSPTAVPWMPTPVFVPTPIIPPAPSFIPIWEPGPIWYADPCPRITCGPSGIAVSPDGGTRLLIENGHLCAGNAVPNSLS